MPTDVTRFINTDSTSGGDGTTNATSGANRAYASLREATEAEAADLVTADQRLILQCSAPSGVADTVQDAGLGNAAWVTDSTRYVFVRPAAGEECDGKFQTDRYRLDLSDDASGLGAGGHDLVLEDIAFRFNGLDPAARAFDSGPSGVGSGVVRFERCVILAHASSNAGTRGFRLRNPSATMRIINCVVADFGSHGIHTESNVPSTFYNVTTANNGGTGIVAGGSLCLVKNCHSTGNATDYSGTVQTGSTTNLSEDTTAPGTSPLTSQTPSFVDEANGDYHLASGDPGRGNATNLSGDGTYAFSTDIDGTTRSAWDIGADEFEAAGGGSGFVNTKIVAIV